jgi:uncharacterized protein YuzB (UPF0349 family)
MLDILSINCISHQPLTDLVDYRFVAHMQLHYKSHFSLVVIKLVTGTGGENIWALKILFRFSAYNFLDV